MLVLATRLTYLWSIVESIPFLSGKPFVIVFLFFLVGVALRSTATFWLGRYGHYLIEKQREPKGGVARRAWDVVHRPSTRKAVDTLQRRGWPIITLGFFTVGVQTAIMLAAGLVGVPGWRFTAAAVPGWIGWATIYSTIGFAAWATIIGAAARSPWAIGVLVTAILAGLAYISYRKKTPHSVEVTAGEDRI